MPIQTVPLKVETKRDWTLIGLLSIKILLLIALCLLLLDVETYLQVIQKDLASVKFNQCLDFCYTNWRDQLVNITFVDCLQDCRVMRND